MRAKSNVEQTINSFTDAEGAAEILCGMHPRTITRWAREGYLPAYPIGEGKRRTWLFDRAELRAWVVAKGKGVESSQPPVLRSERKKS